jgi:hypothetical protein
MGFIPSSSTLYATAYLTEKGREYLFNKNNVRFDNTGNDLFQITSFTLSDSDVNYQTNVLLESGEIPDISGKSEGCLKTTTNYAQTNLVIFQGTISALATSSSSVAYNTNQTNNTTVVSSNSLPTSNVIPVGPIGIGPAPVTKG